jgi:ACS family hexuronate transporter-like MFS transporter
MRTYEYEIYGFRRGSIGYFIIFCICSVSYLIGWIIMKSLVPRYKKIEI